MQLIYSYNRCNRQGRLGVPVLVPPSHFRDADLGLSSSSAFLPSKIVGLALVLLTILSLPSSPAAEVVLSSSQQRFFEIRIRPLLVEHCIQCHGAQKAKGNLRLDSAVSLQQGGASGTPLIDSNKPDNSFLLRVISYHDIELKMPPKGKLTDRQIADLTEWVKMGGPYPASSTTPLGAAPLWAFQQPKAPGIPIVKDVGWAQSPIDHFILAKLEAAGLQPAPRADKRTLIRRVTFDLIGLPPTPAEIEAFLKDNSPEAFTLVVNRLLASPHYGERWGRHWLDVARYADSNGLDENVAFGNAWRYRDWVINAFNTDKPYDQFIMEQLAGDLLPAATDSATRNSRIIATGFLAIGPKVLAEVDEKKMEMDIVDEQIDTMGRAFLGLTLGCARCHDHKFDPISMDDYYGLAGIFQSTRTMEHFKKVARWQETPLTIEHELAARKAHDARLADVKAAIARLTHEASEQVKQSAKPDAHLPSNREPLFNEEQKTSLKQLRDQLAKLENSAPVISTAMAVSEAKVVETPLHLRGSHLTLGKVVSRHVPVILAGAHVPVFDTEQSGRLQLAQWLVRPENPLTSRVLVNRLWRWHFGQGLVRSTDNFGRLGENPLNQPLLDYLAGQLIEKSWSIKAIHRLILLSSTYQMSSTPNIVSLEGDPDNRLHWRASIERLDAESIRDSLLAVSGLLDTRMGGSLLQVKNRDYFFDHTSRDTTRYDSRRRSVYLPVVRNHLYDLFQLFDFPDSSVTNGNRDTTTVAPQALFFLNSDLVAQASECLAKQLLADCKINDMARIQTLYRRVLSRDAGQRDLDRGLAILREMEKLIPPGPPTVDQRRLQAWVSLCQIVLASNEFITLQ